MSTKQKNSKLWRILGIAVIAFVVLAGVAVGAFSIGARSGILQDGAGMWDRHNGQVMDYDEDGTIPYNNRYAMPMGGYYGRMGHGMAFFAIGRIFGGLLFLGLIFGVVRMIFFPHWRRPHFAGPYAPHHPYYHQEDCGCNHAEQEQTGDTPKPSEDLE